MRRKIDDLGRLVIPIEMKREIVLENGSEVDIELEDNKIILTNPKGMKTREEIEQLCKCTNDTTVRETLKWVLNDSKESI
jgi:bifunctional DNA-binding transcriptional regulator/antitoxin component of YhaV-PrlF toxin-antitoxin module